MSDLQNRATLIINADATGANKVINDLKSKTIPSLKEPIKKVGRETGDAFGREFNQQTNKWARLLGQTFGRYFGDWGRQVQEIFYMAKDIREILPSGRRGGGGSAGGGLQTGAIIGADLAGDIYRQNQLVKTLKPPTEDGLSLKKYGINASLKKLNGSDVTGALGTVGAGAGAATAGMGILGSAAVGLGIGAVVVGIGSAISKWNDYKTAIKQVSEELKISKESAKEFVSFWGGIKEDDLKPLKDLVDLLERARQGDVKARKDLKENGLDYGESNDVVREKRRRKIESIMDIGERDKATLRAKEKIGAYDTQFNMPSSDTLSILSKEDRGIIALDAIAVEDSNKSLKEYTETKNRAAIKNGESLPLLFIEVAQLKKKIADEKDILLQNELKKQLVDKELELKATQNNLTEQANKAAADALELDREEFSAREKLLRDKVEAAADEIVAKTGGLYNTDKLSPTQIIGMEADRLRKSTMSPAEIALKNAMKGATLGTSAVKDKLSLARELGDIGSFKKRVSSPFNLTREQENRRQSAALNQLLEDYITHGAVSVKPKNGK